jgi:molybdopterin-binding protein
VLGREHESNLTKTYDSYTTRRDAICGFQRRRRHVHVEDKVSAARVSDPADIVLEDPNAVRSPMRLSARNQLPGRVTAVHLDTVMAEVTIDVGSASVVAAITRISAEQLELRVGDAVTAVIKATDILVGKE